MITTAAQMEDASGGGIWWWHARNLGALEAVIWLVRATLTARRRVSNPVADGENPHVEFGARPSRAPLHQPSSPSHHPVAF